MLKSPWRTIAWLAAAIALMAPAARADDAAAPAAPEPSAAPPAAEAAKRELDPKAIDILKAASRRLAAAKTMSFTATAEYESPSRLGPPLVYATVSHVTLKRPDKLRIVTPGDGPPSEFYYDGKEMMAYSPAEDLVAVAPAPPTIDGALQLAYESAAIYFPFTDVVVEDPYRDLEPSLQKVFYIGRSQVIGGTTTDVLGIVTDHLFGQMWIGAEDKLPRAYRATYLDDPSRLRQVVAFSNWKLDGKIDADAFNSAKAAKAKRIAFARPDPQPPATAPSPGATSQPEVQPSPAGPAS